MKKNRWEFWTVGVLMLFTVMMTGCDDDSNDAESNPSQKVYALSELSGSGVMGTVTFHKTNSTTTMITIQLTGTVAGNVHPAHIHGNEASAGGPIVLDLTAVDGTTGQSITTVTQLNDGTPITYEGLINFNGHVNIHKSAAEIAVMIAQGNIGSNANSISDPNPNPNPYP